MDRYGLVRVAAAVPACKVADTTYNAATLQTLMAQAHQLDASVVLFPALSLTGYTCGDLFGTSTLINGAEQALATLLEQTKQLSTIGIVELPVLVGAYVYRCTVIIQSGRILGVVPQQHVPKCSPLFAHTQCKKDEHITLAGQTAPFCSRLLVQTGRFSFAIAQGDSVPSDAHIVFHPAACPAVAGEGEQHVMHVRQRSLATPCGYVFVSCGVGESTTDMVYSGQVVMAENGLVLLDEAHMDFESKLFVMELDTQAIAHTKNKATAKTVTNSTTWVQADDFAEKLHRLTRSYSPFPFVPDKNKRDAVLSEICTIQAYALAKRMRHTGLMRPVIGVSGGLDSTLALLVVAKATDLLQLPRNNILAVTMPGFGTSSRTLSNAKNLISTVGADQREIDIKPACLQHFSDIGHDPSHMDVTFENTQARERTQLLMNLANQQNGLVIGTGSLSELALGFATYGGDHLSMYSVNSGVPKTLVRELTTWHAQHAQNEQLRQTLLDILDTPVSPELLPTDGKGAISQKTEQILGDYIIHDFFLYHFLYFGFSPEKLLFLATHAFENRYDVATLQNCLAVFVRRFFASQFKRSCLPDGPQVCGVSLSPRTGFSMPSDVQANLWLTQIKEEMQS